MQERMHRHCRKNAKELDADRAHGVLQLDGHALPRDDGNRWSRSSSCAVGGECRRDPWPPGGQRTGGPGRRAALILAGLHLDRWRLRASYIEGGRISYEL